MKRALLGLNQLLSFSATCHTVRPLSSAVSAGQLNTAPPHSSSFTPRCRWYHAASALESWLERKKTPPMPVTLAIGRSYPRGAERRSELVPFLVEQMARFVDDPDVPRLFRGRRLPRPSALPEPAPP